MLIRDVPFKECLNLRVWNHKKTQLGTVVKLNLEPSDRYDSINIEWDDGKNSRMVFHSCCKLEVEENSNIIREFINENML